MLYLLSVTVTPKKGVPDPQGEAVAKMLRQAGFTNVSSVTVGRTADIRVHADTAQEAALQVQEMQKVLGNNLSEICRVAELVEGA